MTAIPDITTNTLVDQTLLANMVTAINSNSDKITRSSSRIYNTVTNKQVTSYVGSFALETNQKVIEHKLDPNSTTVESEPITFSRKFISAPLVFATVEATVTGGTNASVYLNGHSVTMTNVSETGATIQLTVFKGGKKDAKVTFKVSVLAIGLTLEP
jgi:hypothetical protein